jgi:hypothetical protein
MLEGLDWTTFDQTGSTAFRISGCTSSEEVPQKDRFDGYGTIGECH